MATVAESSVRLPLACCVLTSATELAKWEDAWLDVLENSATNEITLTPTWLRTWWEHYGENRRRQLRIGLFFEEGRLIGVAPLLARQAWHYGCLPFRRLELLGSDHDEPDAICSDYLGILAERGYERQVAQALTWELGRGRFGRWDELWLPVMDATGSMPGLLASAFKNAGWWSKKTPYHSAPYLPLPESWDAYLAGLDKRQRYNIKRNQRDFEEWTEGDHRVHRATTPAELERAEQVLEALHAERWSAEGSAGRFRSQRFRAFHQSVMRECLPMGALELSWLEARGEAVAAVYCFRWNGKISYYQCGRKMDLPRNVRPGSVLLCHVIQQAMRNGEREFDFLPEPSQYKLDFGTTLRPLVQVRALRPNWRACTLLGMERTLEFARQLRRRWRSRSSAQAR